MSGINGPVKEYPHLPLSSPFLLYPPSNPVFIPGHQRLVPHPLPVPPRAYGERVRWTSDIRSTWGEDRAKEYSGGGFGTYRSLESNLFGATTSTPCEEVPTDR